MRGSRSSSSSISLGSPSNREIENRIRARDELHNVNSRLATVIDSYDRDSLNTSSLMNLEDLDDMKQNYDNRVKKLEKEFAEQMRAKNREIQDLNRKLEKMKDNQEKKDEEIGELERKLGKLAPMLKQARKERDEQRAGKQKAEHDAETEKVAMKAKNDRLSDENKELRKEVNKLRGLVGDKEKELEDRYKKKLVKELGKRELKWAEEKADMEDALGQRLENVKQSLQRRISDKDDLLKRKDRTIKGMQDELDDLYKERDEVAKKVEDERKRREDLRKEKQRIERDLDKKNRDLQQCEEKIRELTDELSQHKIVEKDLGGEIVDLVNKCDMFEDKLGIESPLRKRKRPRPDPSVTTPIRIVSINDGLNSEDDFVLTLINRRYTGDWKGFEFQNSWTSPIILVGMHFRTNIPGSSTLKIPERRIEPSGILRVCVGDEKKEESDLLWKKLKVDKTKNQKLFIKDGRGKETMLDEVIPGHIEEDNTCRVM